MRGRRVCNQANPSSDGMMPEGYWLHLHQDCVRLFASMSKIKASCDNLIVVVCYYELICDIICVVLPTVLSFHAYTPFPEIFLPRLAGTFIYCVCNQD